MSQSSSKAKRASILVQVSLLAADLIFLSALSGYSQEQQGRETATRTIQGTVRSIGGKRLGIIAKIVLEGEDGGLVTEGLTDSDGRFYFPGLTGRSYRIIVTAEGYEKYEELLPSTMGISLTICNVTMKPLKENAPSEAADEPRSTALAPAKARKDYEGAAKELAGRHLDKAMRQLQSAVKLYPCYAEAQAHLATILENHADSKGAEAALKKAVECDPDYISSYILLGQLLNGQKRFAESAPVLEAGERRAPSSWAVCYELGIAYFGLGKYQQAQGEYQKVSQFTTSPPPELPLRMADVDIKQQAYQKAYAEMKKYLKAQPNGPYAAKVRGIVERVDALNASNAKQAQKQ